MKKLWTCPLCSKAFLFGAEEADGHLQTCEEEQRKQANRDRRKKKVEKKRKLNNPNDNPQQTFEEITKNQENRVPKDEEVHIKKRSVKEDSSDSEDLEKKVTRIAPEVEIEIPKPGVRKMFLCDICNQEFSMTPPEILRHRKKHKEENS